MKRVIVFAGLILLVAACGKETRETPKGHKYVVVSKGDGVVANPGEYILMDIVIKDSNDSVWNDSRNQDVPLILSIQGEEVKETEDGIEEIFRLLSKGDSVIFTMTAKDFFEKTWRQPMPPTMDSSTEFTFYMKLNEILDQAGLQAVEEGMVAKQLQKDIEIIDAHLEEIGIEAQSTPSGLRYFITEEGSGPNAAIGQEVQIHYAGYLLDGTLFDSSMESVARENGSYTEGRPYTPLTLNAGEGQVIAGWEEAMLLMNKGSKMKVWIPSTLAYGPRSRSALIKENSILMFDMEMVDVK
ncbi:MAG: FKBP-type peptidyl-prolyl cis-trans isomerase [Cyclobacteriaceae bacterium]